MYTLGVSADRRYQLQSEAGHRAIDALLEQLRVPAGSWRLYADMLTTVLKLFEDGAGVVNLKITSASLKELRSSVKDSREDLANAFRGEKVDDAQLAVLFDRWSDALGQAKQDVTSALKQIHAQR